MIDLSRDEIMTGLRAGKVLNIDRKDSPTLPTVLQMEREGLVITELVQLDEQSSVLKVRLPEKESGD